jgi:hypothetical protein
MAFIVCIEGQAIGPFAKEAEADKRAGEEVIARGAGAEAQVMFLIRPEWVAVGEPFAVPFEIVHLVDDKPEVHYPYGRDGDSPLNLDDL